MYRNVQLKFFLLGEPDGEHKKRQLSNKVTKLMFQSLQIARKDSSEGIDWKQHLLFSCNNFRSSDINFSLSIISSKHRIFA